MGNHLSKASPDATPLISPNGKEPTKVSAEGDRTVCECKKVLRLGSRRLCAGCGAVGCRVCLPAVIEGHGFCADKCRHKPAEYSVALTLVGAMSEKPREDRAIIWGNVADSLGSDEFVVVPAKVYSTESESGVLPKSYGSSVEPKEYSKQQCYVEALNLHTSSKTVHYWVSIALEMSWFDKVPFPHPHGEHYPPLSLSPLACYRNALCHASQRDNPLTWLNLGAQMPPSLPPQDFSWRLPDKSITTESFDAAACIRKASNLSKNAEAEPYYGRCCETLAALLADKQEENGEWWGDYIRNALKAESKRCKAAFESYCDAMLQLRPTPRIVTEKHWRDYRAARSALCSVFTTIVAIWSKLGVEAQLEEDKEKLNVLIGDISASADDLATQGISFPRQDGEGEPIGNTLEEMAHVMLQCTFFAAMLNPANGSSFFNLETFIEHYLSRRPVSGRLRRGSIRSGEDREPESPALSPAATPDLSAADTPGSLQEASQLTAKNVAKLRGAAEDLHTKLSLMHKLRLIVVLQYERWVQEDRLYDDHRTNTFYHPTPMQLGSLQENVQQEAQRCNSLLDFIVNRGLPMPTVKMRLLLSLSYPEHPAILELNNRFKIPEPRKEIDRGRFGVVYEGEFDPNTAKGTVRRACKPLAVKFVLFDTVHSNTLSSLYQDCSHHREVAILLNSRFENTIVRCMHVKVSKNDGSVFKRQEDRPAPYVIEMYMERAKTTLARYGKKTPSSEEKRERAALLAVKGSWFNQHDKKCDNKLPSGLGVGIVAEFAIVLMKKLEVLHSMDLVHKDIKPANILVFDDTLKLADFGFSAAIHRHSFNVSQNTSFASYTQASDSGAVELFSVGCSAAYLAPEAAHWMTNGGKLDNDVDSFLDVYKANDVYGLGATLLYLCTGYDPELASMHFPHIESDDPKSDYERFNEKETIFQALEPEFQDGIHFTLKLVIDRLTRPDYGGAMFDDIFRAEGDTRFRKPRVQAKDFAELEKLLRNNILAQADRAAAAS